MKYPGLYLYIYNPLYDKFSSLCKYTLETGYPPVNIEQFSVLIDSQEKAV